MTDLVNFGNGEADTDDFWTDDWCDFLDEQSVDYSKLEGDELNSRQLRKVWLRAGRPGKASGASSGVGN